MKPRQRITKARRRVTTSTPAQIPEYRPYFERLNQNGEQRQERLLNPIRR